MDDLIGRILEPLLRRFVKNFKRQQLSLSFMKGRGMLKNMSLNVDEVNNFLDGVPVRFASIRVDQLSIKASLTKLTVKPTTLFVDHMDMDVYEPVDARPTKPSAPAAPRIRRSYGLQDRIGDGISVEINEVRVRFRTLGRRKCPKPGPWNPPEGLMVLKKVRFFSTDEAGFEGSLEECWKYNKGRATDFFIFKKLTVESISFFLLPRHPAIPKTATPIPVLTEAPMEMFLSVRKSLFDVNQVQGLEVDIRLDKAKVRLARADTSYAHFVFFMVSLLDSFNNGWAVTGTDGGSVMSQPPPPDDASVSSERPRGYSDLTRVATSESLEQETVEEVLEDVVEESDSEDSGFEGSSVAPEVVLPLVDPELEMMAQQQPVAQAAEVPHIRVATAMTISSGEIKVVDDGLGGWMVSFNSLRMESIQKDKANVGESLMQIYLSYLDLKELDEKEEPVVMSVMLRPLYTCEPRWSMVEQDKAAFPQMEPRGVRDAFVSMSDAAGAYNSDFLCIKTFSRYPPPPPPQVALGVEAHMERLNVVLDPAAWVPLLNFLVQNMDARYLSGQWGPDVEDYAMLQLEGGGVMDFTLQSEGLTLFLPPNESTANYLSLGAFFELYCGKTSITVTQALPASFLDTAGFLDPRLNHSGSGTPTYGSHCDSSSSYLVPFRCQLDMSDLSLSAPHLTHNAEKLTLIEPITLSLLVSIDCLSPIPLRDPSVCGRYYFPLDKNATLNVSLGLSAVTIFAHPSAWLTFANVVAGLMEAIDQHLVLPVQAVERDEQEPSPHSLQGAALQLVLKICLLQIRVPQLGNTAFRALYSDVMGSGPDSLDLTELSSSMESLPQLVHLVVLNLQAAVKMSPLEGLHARGLLSAVQLDLVDSAVMVLGADQLPPLERPDYCKSIFCLSCPTKAKLCQGGCTLTFSSSSPWPSTPQVLQRPESCPPKAALMVKLTDGLVLTLPAGDTMVQALTSLHHTLCTTSGPLPPALASLNLPTHTQIARPFPQGSLGAILLTFAQRQGQGTGRSTMTQTTLPTKSRVQVEVHVDRVDMHVSGVVMGASPPPHDQESAGFGGVTRAFQLTAHDIVVRGACRDYDDTFEASLTLTAQVQQEMGAVQQEEEEEEEEKVLAEEGAIQVLEPMVVHAMAERSPLEWDMTDDAPHHHHRGWRLHLATSHDAFKAEVPEEALLLLEGAKAQLMNAADHASRLFGLGNGRGHPGSLMDLPNGEAEDLRGGLLGKLGSYFHAAAQEVERCRACFNAAVSEVDRVEYQFARRLAKLEMSLMEKEVQRQTVLAMHFTDYAGFLRAGPHTGKKLRQGGKFLFALPRYWCVLRRDLLICYDRPHSLNVEMTFPLKDCTLREYIPENPNSSRHYKRAYALLWQGPKQDLRTFVLACDSEEELIEWKAALEPYFEPTATTTRTNMLRNLNSRRVSSQPVHVSPKGATSSKGKFFKRGGFLGLSHSGKAHKKKLSFHVPSPLSRKRPSPRSMSADGVVEHLDSSLHPVDGHDPAMDLRKEAERIRQLQVSVRGAVLSLAEPMAKSGGGGAKTPRDAPTAAYIISTALPGRARRLGFMRESSRRKAPSQPPSLESTGMSGEDKSSVRAVETCVTRQFQDLLGFHGRYLEQWIRSLEQAAHVRGGEAGADLSLAFCSHPLTGMHDMEALSYANHLLLGAQKILDTFSDNEALRRTQVDTVERYLRILVSCCPPDKQCISWLYDMLGIDPQPLESGCGLGQVAEGGGVCYLSERGSTGVPQPTTCMAAAPRRGSHGSMSPTTTGPLGRSEEPLVSPLGINLAVSPPVGGGFKWTESDAPDLTLQIPALHGSTSQRSRVASHQSQVGESSHPGLALAAAVAVDYPRVPPPQLRPPPNTYCADSRERIALSLFLGAQRSLLLTPMSRTSVTNIPLDVDLGEADDGMLKTVLARFQTQLVQVERALDTTRLAFVLQTAVMEDYMHATRLEQAYLRGQIGELQEAVAQQTKRNAALETEALRARLARDGALFAVAEVTAHSSRKLMDAELRYMHATASGKTPRRRSNSTTVRAATTSTEPSASGASTPRRPSGGRCTPPPPPRAPSRRGSFVELRVNTTQAQPPNHSLYRSRTMSPSIRGSPMAAASFASTPERRRSSIPIPPELPEIVTGLIEALQDKEQDKRELQECITMANEEVLSRRALLYGTFKMGEVKEEKEARRMSADLGSVDPFQVWRAELEEERRQRAELERQLEELKERQGRFDHRVHQLLMSSASSSGGGARTNRTTAGAVVAAEADSQQIEPTSPLDFEEERANLWALLMAYRGLEGEEKTPDHGHPPL